MSNSITVADLKDQTGTPEPRPVLYCKKCGSTCSANAGDYFSALSDTVLKHCGEPMVLAVRRVVFDEVVVGNDVDSYGARLDVLLAAHEASLDALGERVRAEIVVPLCHKYRLTFSSGMGMYCFSKKNGQGRYYHHREELDLALSSSARAALGPVLDLLNMEINRNADLGHYVADVE